MSFKNLLIALLLGSALAAGVFVATKMNTPSLPTTAFVIPEPADLPEFSLLDQADNLVNADTFRGQWDLVFFGFTNCPDVCPTTMQLLSSVKRELAASGATRLPRIVLVSVDPERDTPDSLGRYVDYFGTDHLAVTGALEEVIKLTGALGIYFEKTSMVDGTYSVDHSAAVLVVDPDGRFAALFSAPHTIANFLHDLPIITGDQ